MVELFLGTSRQYQNQTTKTKPKNMAILIKNSRSPYYYFKFRLAGGKQVSRVIEPQIEHSPKGETAIESKVMASRNRQTAQAMANRAEEASKMAMGGATAEQMRDFLSDVVNQATGKNIRPDSIKKTYEDWIDRERKKGKNEQTMANYEARFSRFLNWLGDRAKKPADSLTLADCQAFYDLRAVTISPTTVKKELEVLGMAFATAVKKGILRFNPWGGIDRVRQFRKKGVGSRRAFTEEQLKKLLAVAEPEMAGLIYLQAYAGLRLGDASRLKWSSIDFNGAGGVGVISFQPEKATFEKEHNEPIHPVLKKYLQARKNKAKRSDAYIFPTLATKPISGAGGLSLKFKRVMREAGIDCQWQEARGDQGKRVATLSNHSLRYFFSATLRENAVSMENRMELIGHTNESVHKGYSGIEIQKLAKELSKVKALTPPSLVS